MSRLAGRGVLIFCSIVGLGLVAVCLVAFLLPLKLSTCLQRSTTSSMTRKVGSFGPVKVEVNAHFVVECRVPTGH